MPAPVTAGSATATPLVAPVSVPPAVVAAPLNGAPSVAPHAAPASAHAPPPPPPPTLAPPSVARAPLDGALKQLVDSKRAVKVVVKRSARDEGLYIVRPADGTSLPPGAREALVVLLDADEGFFAPAKPRE